ncbi:hypothetical protein BDV24DRAFT_164628 [Aspergillus arachidicola]|uniref:Uncharacterized protein n=1 Tax=Aspergillus arachidicola TaxID=656916 RepID=A0A2G7FEQ6_9EURO|nr:hypothetical protein BDV24DRAFT_164628 [Aspergillus arachidicola]PIG79090.1 hypothetical protein AARAC_008022 [Aspergillus arachidicola]
MVLCYQENHAKALSHSKFQYQSSPTFSSPQQFRLSQTNINLHFNNSNHNSNMQLKSLFVVMTGLMAFAAAAPTEAEARDTTNVQARKSWTAEGGCKVDWAGRCNAQCIGEGVRSHGCKKDDISSGIESSNCIIGWNICKCSC